VDGSAGPREVRRDALWTPREGNAGLVDRLATLAGTVATTTDEVTPVSLVPPPADPLIDNGGPALQSWRVRAAQALGFVPSVGAAERTRWQGFLAARHATLAGLQAAHGIAYASFDVVPLPRDWPAAAGFQSDWRAFQALADDGAWTRARWQDFLARRWRRIERLNLAWGTAWPTFDDVALPDVVPETEAAQRDWLAFERQVLAMHRTAHRFSVLLPVDAVMGDPYALEARLGLARRIVELEKPAHTVFDVRFFWAFFRVGEARLGLDTALGAGSRAPELIPDAVLGRTYIGAAFVGGDERLHGGDRLTIAC
jgi:hypothetical protein